MSNELVGDGKKDQILVEVNVFDYLRFQKSEVVTCLENLQFDNLYFP